MKCKVSGVFIALGYSVMLGAMEVPEECFPKMGAALDSLCNLTFDAYIEFIRPTSVHRRDRDQNSSDGERYQLTSGPKKDLEYLMRAIQRHANLEVEQSIWGESVQDAKFSPEELTDSLGFDHESPLLCAIRLMNANFHARICASLLVKATGPQECLCHILNNAPAANRAKYLKRAKSFLADAELKKCAGEPWFAQLNQLNLSNQ